MTTTSKLKGYTARMGEDLERRVFYSTASDGPEMMRVTTRVVRVPSTGEFVVRMLKGATADERRRSERMAADAGSLSRKWRRWERQGGTRRHWNKTNRRWMFIAYTGDLVDVDGALMELELEMMLDQDQEAPV